MFLRLATVYVSAVSRSAYSLCPLPTREMYMQTPSSPRAPPLKFIDPSQWRWYVGTLVAFIFAVAAASLILNIINAVEVDEIEDVRIVKATCADATQTCLVGVAVKVDETFYCEPEPLKKAIGAACTPDICWKNATVGNYSVAANAGACDKDGVCIPTNGSSAGQCEAPADCPHLSIFAADGTTSIVASVNCTTSGVCTYSLNPDVPSVDALSAAYGGDNSAVNCLNLASQSPYHRCLSVSYANSGSGTSCRFIFDNVTPVYP